MSFKVRVQQEAWTQALTNADWWAKHRSPDQAERWFDGLMLAIDSLKTTATRHATSAKSGAFPFDLAR